MERNYSLSEGVQRWWAGSSAWLEHPTDNREAKGSNPFRPMHAKHTSNAISTLCSSNLSRALLGVNGPGGIQTHYGFESLSDRSPWPGLHLMQAHTNSWRLLMLSLQIEPLPPTRLLQCWQAILSLPSTKLCDPLIRCAGQLPPPAPLDAPQFLQKYMPSLISLSRYKATTTRRTWWVR